MNFFEELTGTSSTAVKWASCIMRAACINLYLSLSALTMFTIAFCFIYFAKETHTCNNGIADFAPQLAYGHLAILLIYFAKAFFGMCINFSKTGCEKGFKIIEAVAMVFYFYLWFATQIFFYQRDNDCWDGWYSLYYCCLLFIVYGYLEVAWELIMFLINKCVIEKAKNEILDI